MLPAPSDATKASAQFDTRRTSGRSPQSANAACANKKAITAAASQCAGLCPMRRALEKALERLAFMIIEGVRHLPVEGQACGADD